MESFAVRVAGGDASGVDCSLGEMINGDVGVAMLTALAASAMPGKAPVGNAPGISIGVYIGVGVVESEVSGVGSF
jgi:hypothetical protein